MARGYWNNETLTNGKFTANPFSHVEGGLFYRTGDMGKWLPDGNIEYLGRLDEQLKIRGYRIEPGEIEAIARLSGLVSHCVVLAREGREEDKILVGYAIPTERFDRKELIRYLQTRLPLYMIPGLWVVLPEFPLTTNGKIDQRALLEISPDEISSDTYIAPGNELEAALAAIWQELLHVGQVGIYDDFFALGGHSLLGMQLTSAIKKRFHLDIPLKIIFRFPCIADLADYISVMQPESNEEQNDIRYEIFEL